MSLKSYIKEKISQPITALSSDDILFALDLINTKKGECWRYLFGKNFYLSGEIECKFHIIEKYIKKKLLDKPSVESSRELAEEISDIKVVDVPAFVWIILSQILIMAGFFIPAYYARNNAIKSAITDACGTSINPNVLALGAKAAYEINDLESLKKIYKKSFYWKWINKNTFFYNFKVSFYADDLNRLK